MKSWPNPKEIQSIDSHQREQLALATTSRIGILGGSPGTGKAQPLSAKVLTPTGWKTMADIGVGSIVIGSDGKPTQINAIHPQGQLEVFEVVFSDGSKAECCKDHLWQTTTRKQRQSKKPSTAKPLSEIMQTMDRGDGSPNHKIPMVGKVEFEKNHNLIHPYLMGVLLGDGCFASQRAVLISNPEAEIIDRCKELLPDGCEIRQRSGTIDYRICDTLKTGVNRINSEIVRLSLNLLYSSEKFIPKEYLYSSVEDREELLRGLLDTDGYTDGHNIEYCTTSEFLAKGVTELVQSLGGTVTVSIKENPKYKHKGEERTGKPCFRIIVKLPPTVQPFRLKRKLEKYIPKSKYIPTRYIIDVIPIGTKQCQCISVANEDGLYITTSYIVTHNTYTVAKLVRHLLDNGLIALEDIGIGAPTGKAAVRLTEMLQSNGIDVRARTEHSMLEIGEHSETGQWTFLRNEKNPLPYRLIVIDETSMNDLSIMLSIFRARAPGCFALLVGDVNQLPPVGNGAPLLDMIAAGLPYGELREIKRNSGGIVEACGLIRDCLPWVDLTESPGSNLRITHDTTPSEKQARILDLLNQARRDGYDPIWDCQVLVAVNESSPLSRQSMNKLLQDSLNPNEKCPGTEFRVADKIVCLKNGFYKSEDPDGIDDEAKKNERGEVYVANGELAEVIEVTDKAVIAKMASPARVVSIPIKKPTADLADESDDEPAKQTGTKSNWDLGYALSVHKSQGSEWPVVIVALDGYAGAKMICDRAWLYTAISRGKQVVHLVGPAELAERFCVTQKIAERKTFLSDRIKTEIFKTEIEYL